MYQNELCSIKWGTSEFFFTIYYENRKNLKITVNPDKTVAVVAPIDAGINDVFNKVRKRALWIKKQFAYYNNYPVESPVKKYVSGETHKYLGKQYRLKIKPSEDESCVKLLKGYIKISTAFYDDENRKKSMLLSWYKEKLDIHIHQIINDYNFFLVKYKLQIPKFDIKILKKRWGSCSKNGKLSFNIELIKQKKYCIEYVVLHELCHLIEYNHNDKFYSILNKYMPDREKRKNNLNQNAELSL